jgi:Xaa-Pro aminopeptidase
MRKLNRVFRQLRQQGVDCFLIINPLNIFYLTGYTPVTVKSADLAGLIHGTGAALLVLKSTAKLFVAKLNYDQALKEASQCEVISNGDEPIVQAAKYALSRKIQILGYETAVTHASYGKLKHVCSGVRLKGIDDLIESMRIRKDDEVHPLKRSAKITSQVFNEILPFIKPGVRELDLALDLEYRLRKKGADRCAFSPIVASGPNSALPHAAAGRRRIRKGDFLVVDLGAYYKGYASDMTRTVVIGRPSQKQREVYGAVREAQHEAMRVAKAGIACKSVDKAARDVISRWGFEEGFIHSLGHGVGLAVHELPYLSLKSRKKLESGMVVTIEPGVYIRGWGGVRIEDTVLIEESGISILTSSKRELVEV